MKKTADDGHFSYNKAILSFEEEMWIWKRSDIDCINVDSIVFEPIQFKMGIEFKRMGMEVKNKENRKNIENRVKDRIQKLC